MSSRFLFLAVAFLASCRGCSEPEPTPTTLPQPGVAPSAPFVVESPEVLEARGAACGKQAADLGDWLYGVVFSPKSSVAPAVSSLEPRLAAIRPLERAMASPQLTNLYWEVNARCIPARRILGRVSEEGRDQQMRVLAEELPIALAECDCQADVDALRSLLWDLNHRYNAALQPG